jgi:hypothetical protein
VEKMKKTVSLFLFLFLSCSFFGQDNVFFKYWEDSLIVLRNNSINASNDIEKLQKNEDFMNLLEEILEEKDSFKYNWSTTSNFSVVTSSDKQLKIFTWNVMKKDFSCENFGFLQVYNENRKKYILYPLFDNRNLIDYPSTFVGNHNHWYGAIYYDIILIESKHKKYYTLLGYNANNLFSNQKVIDVLSFKSDGTPIFGAFIFKKYPQKVSRVLFEYSKKATFTLKYEKQSYDVSTGKRDPKTRKLIYKNIPAKMIIFEQLVPLDDGLDGITAFLVPESSLNQGFIENEGKWLFLPNVKGRNPDKENPKYIKRNRNFKKNRYE